MPPTRRPKDAWRATPAGESPRANARPSRGRWFRTAVGVAILIGSVVAVATILWPRPEPVMLALSVSRFRNPDWPPNPWAEADAAGVRARFGPDSAHAIQDQEKARLVRKLDEFATATRAEYRGRPAIVDLIALATVHAGEVHLIPGDADPANPVTWLPLAAVLDAIGGMTGPRLVILDLRPIESPRLPNPTDDVNAVLIAELTRRQTAGMLDFPVLIAATPPTGPVTLPAWKRTAFGLAVAQALGGAADGCNPTQSRDSWVSVQELTEFTRITLAATPSTRLPRLFGPGGDLLLIRVPARGPEPLPAPEELPAYPEWLSKAWQERDGWVHAGLARRTPRLIADTNAANLHAETRWLAGDDPTAVAEDLARTLSRLRVAASTASAPRPAVLSIARGEVPEANAQAVAAAWRPLLDALKSGHAKPEELATFKQTLRDKPADTAPFDATAAVVFDFALRLPEPTPERITELAMMIRSLPAPGPRQAELATLDAVAGLPPGQAAKRWPPGTLKTLLLVARAAEQAVAVDGRLLAWLKPSVEMADADRRAALVTLADPDSPDDALIAARRKLESALDRYRITAGLMAAANALMIATEETRAVLADLAGSAPDHPPPIAEDAARTWRRLTDGYSRAKALLAATTPPPAPELRRLADELTAACSLVRELFPAANASAALAWPQWSTTERLALMTRVRADRSRLVDRVQSLGPTKPGGASPVDRPPDPVMPGHRAGRREELRTLGIVAGTPEPGDAAILGSDLTAWRAAETRYHEWLATRAARDATNDRQAGLPAAAETRDAVRRRAAEWKP